MGGLTRPSTHVHDTGTTQQTGTPPPTDNTFNPPMPHAPDPDQRLSTPTAISVGPLKSGEGSVLSHLRRVGGVIRRLMSDSWWSSKGRCPLIARSLSVLLREVSGCSCRIGWYERCRRVCAHNVQNCESESGRYLQLMVSVTLAQVWWERRVSLPRFPVALTPPVASVVTTERIRGRQSHALKGGILA